MSWSLGFLSENIRSFFSSRLTIPWSFDALWCASNDVNDDVNDDALIYLGDRVVFFLWTKIVFETTLCVVISFCTERERERERER